MAAEDFRPKWVGPGSVIFPLLVFAGFVVALVVGGYFALQSEGPSPEDRFFAQTLPRWWIARSQGEPSPPDGRLFQDLPHPALKAPFERIDGLMGDPEAVAIETIGLNQTLEELAMPYWVDVVVRGRFPLLLVFRVVKREEWRIGEEVGEVLRVARLDRTNIATAFSGKTARDLPVVILDSLEASILQDLRAPASRSEKARAAHPVERLHRAWVRKYVDDNAGPGAWAAAQAAIHERDLRMLKMERRLKRGNVRVDRPERFRLSALWYENLEAFTEQGSRRTLIFSGDLEAVREADVALNSGLAAAALQAMLELWADVDAALQAHMTLGPPLDSRLVPPSLASYYEGDNPDFLSAGHRHLRSAVGGLRDGQAPACATLLRVLRAAAGPRVRYTAFHYGSMATLKEILQPEDLNPDHLADRVKAACEEGDDTLRRRAATILEAINGAEASPSSESQPSLPTHDRGAGPSHRHGTDASDRDHGPDAAY